MKAKKTKQKEKKTPKLPPEVEEPKITQHSKYEEPVILTKSKYDEE